MASYRVWIEAEEWDAGEWTPEDAASDVVVTLADGTRWIATFVSYQHVLTLRDRNREAGEALGGRYLWGSDIVLVETIERSLIESVIEELMSDQSFELAFGLHDEDDPTAL